MNYNQHLETGEHYIVHGQPYFIRTDQEDYFWSECKDLVGVQLRLSKIYESSIPLLTHRHVDSRFGAFIKLVFTALDGTDFHFHSDDLTISQGLHISDTSTCN